MQDDFVAILEDMLRKLRGITEMIQVINQDLQEIKASVSLLPETAAMLHEMVTSMPQRA